MPLSRAEARALDTKIRATRGRLIADAVKLVDLIEQAERGQIHVAFGCSPKAWVSDAVRIPRKGVDDDHRRIPKSRTPRPEARGFFSSHHRQV